eukprot:3226975-Amphidinium_carterae.1
MVHCPAHRVLRCEMPILAVDALLSNVQEKCIWQRYSLTKFVLPWLAASSDVLHCIAIEQALIQT